MAQRGYLRYPLQQDGDQYNHERRQRYPTQRDSGFQDNHYPPYDHPERQRRYPADRDDRVFQDRRERRPEESPPRELDQDGRGWRQQTGVFQGPDSISEPGSGDLCECCSGACGDGHGDNEEMREAPHGQGRGQARPMYMHDDRPRPGGAGGRGHGERVIGWLAGVEPGMLPRMDGPALRPFLERPPRWMEELEHGASRLITERRDSIGRPIRPGWPPISDREYREWVVAPQGGGSHRYGHGTRGEYRGGGGGVRHEGLPPGVRYVQRRDVEEDLRYR